MPNAVEAPLRSFSIDDFFLALIPIQGSAGWHYRIGRLGLLGGGRIARNEKTKGREYQQELDIK